jgi:hypothetical protein
MARLGHSSPRTALVYQHATEERDHTIGAGIDALLAAEEAQPAPAGVELAAEEALNRSRTDRARRRRATSEMRKQGR